MQIMKQHDLKPHTCFTVCVEGNIGSGKSTLLEYFKTKVEEVEVCEEPVHLWQNVDGSNVLDLMYKNPSRWSYTFQTYVLLTMMQIHNQQQKKKLRFIERSAYSAVYCFVENLYLSGHISHLEYTIHHQWFDWLRKNQTPKIDLFVYIRTSPNECLERVKARGREEEAELPIALLHQLHDRYEEWFVKKCKFDLPAPVLVIDGNKSVEEIITYYHEKCETVLTASNHHDNL